jgi:hypothetical protein
VNGSEKLNPVKGPHVSTVFRLSPALPLRRHNNITANHPIFGALSAWRRCTPHLTVPAPLFAALPAESAAIPLYLELSHMPKIFQIWGPLQSEAIRHGTVHRAWAVQFRTIHLPMLSLTFFEDPSKNRRTPYCCCKCCAFQTPSAAPLASLSPWALPVNPAPLRTARNARILRPLRPNSSFRRLSTSLTLPLVRVRSHSVDPPRRSRTP